MRPARAADALERLARTTRPSGTAWALGIEARSRALVSEGEAAELLYREAIDRLGRTAARPTWPARTCSTANGCAGRTAGPTRARSCAPPTTCSTRWAWRRSPSGPGRELRATGETARKRTAVAMNEELTAQEAQIARLARDGLSNPEIGARLFISARTVQYHLGKVFTKLEISSRSQLNRVLPGDPLRPGPANPQDPRRSL